MLNKNQSNKRNSWKYALVIPTLIAFVLLFQVEVVAKEKEINKVEKKIVKINKEDKNNLTITKNTSDEEIKGFCDKLKNTYNIDLTFFNIKRNTNGEIINIESEFKNKSGNSGSFIQNDNRPIKPFRFFYDENQKEKKFISMEKNQARKNWIN